MVFHKQNELGGFNEYNRKLAFSGKNKTLFLSVVMKKIGARIDIQPRF
jgi:hypothetical protein